VAVAFGQPEEKPVSDPALRAAIDKIFYREALLVEEMHKYSPLVETYIQDLKPDTELGTVPVGDKYFLGRLVLDERGIGQKNFQRQAGLRSRVLDKLNTFYKMSYVPLGFMQLLFLNDAFDRDNYDLKFLRRQFLGEVRTLVFDVSPLSNPKDKGPHFVGRIWVEDQDYNIVRINGTFAPRSRTSFYFHFDSWRVNMRPGLWLPAYVYTEESDTRYAFFRKLMMKGQTRLWGYDLKHSGEQQEFTEIQVDAQTPVKDESSATANDVVPLESQHQWEREAEDNVLDRLERAGLLAPEGDVSRILQTVINNLEITNKLDIQPEIRARVLLTTPMESFTLGNTIIVSRGLLDVLPDEASLAMILAHELGHITLGQRINTKYAFSDRMIFPDEDTFRRIDAARNSRDEEAADQKGYELLKNSPYAAKLSSAGLFLRALEGRSRELSWLISPHLGNRLTKGNTILRMSPVMQGAPQLENGNTSQIAALPLGSRIKLDPWDNHVQMQKSKAVAPRSARDKMPFEVTPIYPNLARYRSTDTEAKVTAAAPVSK
jgi:hypothetical protein